MLGLQLSISSASGTLSLIDVLVCPIIKKSLLYVSKLCDDQNCGVFFDANDIYVIDLDKLTVVAKGPRSNGLYRLENRGFEVNFSDRQVVASEAVWHYRLGHSNPKTLQQFSSSKEIMMNKSRTTPLCGPCQMWKSSILQFFLQFQMYLSL